MLAFGGLGSVGLSLRGHTGGVEKVRRCMLALLIGYFDESRQTSCAMEGRVGCGISQEFHIPEIALSTELEGGGRAPFGRSLSECVSRAVSKTLYF